MLLGLKYTEMSFDYANPLRDHDPDCLPCLFLQFAVSEGGMRVSKMLQVFSRQVTVNTRLVANLTVLITLISRQAVMMDALIASHVEEIRRRAAMYGDDLDGAFDGSTDVDGRWPQYLAIIPGSHIFRFFFLQTS